MNVSKKPAPLWITLMKIAISVGALTYLIHYMIFRFPKDTDFTELFLSGLRFTPLLLISAFFNWGTEALKWQKLISPFERITLLKSFKAVVSGVSIGLFTPNRIGEYAGRIWFVDKKIPAVSATIAGNICQLAITLLFGLIGFWIIPLKIPFHLNYLYIPALITLLVLVLYIFRSQWLHRIKLFRKEILITFLQSFRLITPESWGFSLLLSVVRYLFFWLPFVWILSALYTGSTFSEMIWIVPLTYFIQAIIPTFAMAEAGTRAVSIAWVAESAGFDPAPAIAASLIVWLFNVILPALAGLAFIWKIPNHTQ